MTEETEEQYLTTKFYSQKTIALATYLGGPLAAGILIRRNFINLGKEVYGKHAIVIGIISTLLVFVLIFSIPENILDKIPRALIPAVYTLIIYLIVEKFQGKQLKEHKNSDGKFYSVWKATGVGLVCMVIIIGGIFGYIYLKPSDNGKEYDQAMNVFYDNETKALDLFKQINTATSTHEIVYFIDKKGIPYWQSNLKILSKVDKLDGISDKGIQQDEILRDYCKLRIEQYLLIKKAALENKMDENKMKAIVDKIDKDIAKLKKINL